MKDYTSLLIQEYYKDNFYAFAKDVFKSYRGDNFKPHYTVQLLCEHIEYNIKGEYEWGIYNLPRGWGKSVIISELASAWALLRNGKERVACYSKKLSEDAKDWHEKSHQAMTCDFTKTFINDNAVETYNKFVLRTPEGGYRRVASCLSSSVGSDITLGIMDDPQGEDQITSEAKRNRLHNFFSNGLLRAVRTVDYTSMNDLKDLQLTESQKKEYELTIKLESEVSSDSVQLKPRMILVMQRLFPRDFCFYVENMIEAMEKQGVSKPHTKLSIPAIHTEPKKYIFPKSKQIYQTHSNEYTLASTLTEKYILQAKAQMHSSSFEAQMQQNPISTEGQLINTSDLRYYTQEMLSEEFEMYFITTDFATTEVSENADYSVVCCWGVDSQSNLFLLDIERIRGGGLKVDAMLDNMYNKWKDGLHNKSGVRCIYIENVTGSQNLIQRFQAQYGDAKRGGLVYGLSRTKGKFLRFLEVGGFIENGKVYLPDQDVKIKHKSITPYIADLLQECENFRENESDYMHDDMVDCLLDACFVASVAKPRIKVNTKVSSV